MFKFLVKLMFRAAVLVWILATVFVGLAKGFEAGLTIFALPLITIIAVLYAIWPIVLIVGAFWIVAKMVRAIRAADAETEGLPR